VYYEVHGSGPAIVFAHGAEGNTLSWFQQVPWFAQRFRVITFDHRGWGRSECHPDALHVSHFADDLRAILDAEGITRAALVGHSTGGWTVLRAALDYPERVACLVLSSTAGGVVTPSLMRLMTESAARVAKGEPWWKLFLSPDFEQRDPALAFLQQQILQLNAPLDAGMVAQATEAQVHPEEFAGYTVPTLLLIGERDELNRPGLLQEAARAIPGVKTLEIAEAGYSIHFEAPGVFNRVVSEFVLRHVAA
jgi:pimeloyl-ACP methyl ester carboxylesterase